MTPEDVKQVNDMIQGAVVAGLAAYDSRRPSSAPSRSTAEVGSPEFAEDRTQVNSLNNKWIFETAMDRFLARSTRSDDHYADLQSRSLESLTEVVSLQKKVNSAFFDKVEDGRRLRDMWAYETAYDLGNPVTTGVGDDTRAGAITANRAVDTATVQSVVNSNTFQAAISGAVADAMNGTIPTLEAAVGAAVAAALANTPVKPTTGVTS